MRPPFPLLLVGAAFLAGPAWAQEAAEVAAAPTPWTADLLLSIAALSMGGGSAILGMWLTRDRKRPLIFAFAMTFLIGTAVFVGITQSYLDAVDAIQKRQDLERMMDMVKEIAVNTGDHELAALIEAEGGGTVEIVDLPEADTDVPVDDTDSPAEEGPGDTDAAPDAEAPADAATTDDP